MAPKAAVLTDTREDVLGRLHHAIDLARIVRNDSIRGRRQRTTASGHINNLETLLKALRDDLEGDTNVDTRLPKRLLG